MTGRWIATALILLGLAASEGAATMRPAHDRPDVIEIGAPVLISRDLLKRELRRNSEMRLMVSLYGWPDYAEVQEIKPEYPYLPYEVRLYYLSRNEEWAFSPVIVSPALTDYGVRKYRGDIPDATLQRLLTPEAAPPAP
jgi:hypothetical protein